MSDTIKNHEGAGKQNGEPGNAPAGPPESGTKLVPPARQRILTMPGLAAIAIYMLVLAGIIVVGVASGHMQPMYLLFSALFIAASFGLMLFLRWAWALTLAAVVLLFSLFLWRFSVQREPSSLIQGLLNLVFFFYLVRTEVRRKLR